MNQSTIRRWALLIATSTLGAAGCTGEGDSSAGDEERLGEGTQALTAAVMLNGGFETGDVAGFRVRGVTMGTTSAPHGAVARLRGATGWVAQDVTSKLTPGTTYVFQASVRAAGSLDSSTGLRPRLRVDDCDPSTPEYDGATAAAPFDYTWQTLTTSFQYAGGQQKVCVRVTADGYPGDTYVDDVSVSGISLANPSFDSGTLAGWEVPGVGAVTGSPHTGSYAAELRGGVNAFLSQDIAARLVAGVEYTFFVHAKVTDTGTGPSWSSPRLRLGSTCELGKEYGEVAFQNSVSAGWQERTLKKTFTPAELSGPVCFGVTNIGFNGVVRLDDIAVTHGWSRRHGGAIADHSSDILVDASSNIILAGTSSGDIDFGGGPLTGANPNNYAAYLAKLGPDSEHVWSRYFISTASMEANHVAEDPAGNLLFNGSFSGSVTFGGPMLTASSYNDAFLAKFDASGNHLWSKRFGIGRNFVVAADGANNVLFAGNLKGTMDFDGQQVSSTTPWDTDVVVAKLNGAGDVLWVKRYGDEQGQSYPSVAVDSANNVVVAGHFAGVMDMGGGPLASAGLDDLFVAKLGAGGEHVWSKRYGDAARQFGVKVAVLPDDSIIVTGKYSGSCDLGGGPLSPVQNGGFVTKLDPQGNHVWSMDFGDDAAITLPNVALDGSGNIIVTASFDGTVDLGGGPLTSSSAGTWFYGVFAWGDILVVKLDTNGNHLGSVRMGNGGMLYATAVSTDVQGDLLLTGDFASDQGTLDLGHGPMTSAGSWDVFLARLRL